MMFESVVERNHRGRGGEDGVGSLVNAAELRHDFANHEDFCLGTVDVSNMTLGRAHNLS